jgi:hypothetical protein
MFRKTLLTLAVALPVGLMGAAPAALADRVHVYFGVPFYSHQVGPRYVYYDDYGWYDPYRYPRFRRIHRTDDDYAPVYEDDDDGYVGVYDDDYDDDYVVIRGD